MTPDSLPELAEICGFIQKHINSGAVLVHCERGVSRSAITVIAYLMQACQYDLATALAFVREKRKVKPNENFKEQLEV
jgi:protein-tyrosine phosphatase